MRTLAPTEFIQLVSSEANEVATREKRQTIGPEHVIKAMRELGFEEFVEGVNSAWEQFKEDSKGACTVARSQLGHGAGVLQARMRRPCLDGCTWPMRGACHAASLPAVGNANRASLRMTGADREGLSAEEQVCAAPCTCMRARRGQAACLPACMHGLCAQHQPSQLTTHCLRARHAPPQIALQQQMFAAARAQSMTSSEDAAAMAAAYQEQLAVFQQRAASRGAASADALGTGAEGQQPPPQ